MFISNLQVFLITIRAEQKIKENKIFQELINSLNNVINFLSD